jgi:phosphoribosylformimino-5-aminoimidazole carboxamide ribonucleotide (ProFAR) isomerase
MACYHKISTKLLTISLGEVVVDGWKTKTGSSVFDKIEELKPFVSGFLVTFVETEGSMKGINLEQVEKLAKAVGKKHELTVAGGITTVEEIKTIAGLNVR